MAGGQRDELIAPIGEKRVAADHKGAGLLLDDGRENRVEITLGAGIQNFDLLSHSARGFLQLPRFGFGNWIVRIYKYGDYGGFRDQVMEQFQSFRAQDRREEADPRGVAAGPVEARDEAVLHRITAGSKYDW